MTRSFLTPSHKSTALISYLKLTSPQSKQDFLHPDDDYCLSGRIRFSPFEAGRARGSRVSINPLQFRPSRLSDALSMRLYQCLTLVFFIISSNACRPSITLRTPYTACRQMKWVYRIIQTLQMYVDIYLGGEGGYVCPHQVSQVGLVSTHELPVLADGCHPAINCFVEILSDIVLQVVSKSRHQNTNFIDKRY